MALSELHRFSRLAPRWGRPLHSLVAAVLLTSVAACGAGLDGAQDTRELSNNANGVRAASEGTPTEEPRAWGMSRHAAMAADGAVQIHFTRPGTVPGEEEDPEADDVFVDAIRAATTTVDLCLYEFDRANIVDAVIEAHTRGVRVRFAGDGDESHDAGYVRMAQAGIPMVLRNPNDRIMHNKFAVIDGRVVITGSLNFSQTEVMYNNNHMLRIDSRDMAAIYTAEFEQMFTQNRFGRRKVALNPSLPLGLGSKPAYVYFSPMDRTDLRLREVIATADHHVHFMIFSFTHQDVANDLVGLFQRGVNVYGVFDESQATSRYSMDTPLAQAGLPIFIDGNKNSRGFAGGKLHHKVMLIDAATDSDPTVVIGSYNWSGAGTMYNDENMVVLHGSEFVAPFLEEFCRVLEVATPHPNITQTPTNPCTTLLRPVRINEFMPDPDGIDLTNEWVEIVNSGKSPISLQGWKIGNSLKPEVHVFGDVVLPPGAALVIHAGAHPTEPWRQTASSGALRLTNSADEVILRDADNVIVDRVAYRSAKSGISFNRNPDGAAQGDFILHNQLGTGRKESVGRRADGTRWTGLGRVIINEVFVDPRGENAGKQFVELVNMDDASVDVTGWSLANARGEVRHVFGGQSIAPRESTLVIDQANALGVRTAVLASAGTLNLLPTGDTLYLYDPMGRMVDTVAVPATVTEGVSWNRAIDGDESTALILHNAVQGSWTTYSPGRRVDGAVWTGQPAAGRIIINELLPNPMGTDLGEEYVEIVNVGDASVDLSGWTLGDAVDARRHVFAAGQRLGAGQALVIYDRGSRPHILNAITASSTLLSLNNSTETITIFDATGAAIDAVSYATTREGVSLNRQVDGDPLSLFVNHTLVTGAVGNLSPGVRATGAEWN